MKVMFVCQVVIEVEAKDLGAARSKLADCKPHLDVVGCGQNGSYRIKCLSENYQIVGTGSIETWNPGNTKKKRGLTRR